MDININDKRLKNRIVNCANSITQSAGLSFPQIFKKPSELLGFYRLINNPKFQWSQMLDEIYKNTLVKICNKKKVFVLHDTTEVTTSCLDSNLHLHFSIAADVQTSLCYGVLNLIPWIRKTRQESKNNCSENYRWFEGVDLIEKNKLALDVNYIHVMDREGDSYRLFHKMYENNFNYIVRMRHGRFSEGENVVDRVLKSNLIETRLVTLSKKIPSRLPKTKKTHPGRDSRRSNLEIRAEEITIERSKHESKLRLKKLKINLICITEKDPPQNEKAICWYLLTNLPINTTEEILFVIDGYRKRWLIEEFFKALKSGCKIEERQFETLNAWMGGLSFLIEASSMLLNQRQTDEELGLGDVYTEVQIKILEKLGNEFKMPLNNCNDSKLIVAKLGGHIKYNGPPGWIVLMKGMLTLLNYERGWLLFNEKM
jgi:hypothetical protein